jgi:hypothetical protein
MVRLRRTLLPSLLVTSLFIFTGCTNNQDAIQNKPSTNSGETGDQSASGADPKLTYAQYRQLYNDMSANLTLPSVKKVEDYTDRGYLVFVEPELTFGKRNVLTLTGEQTNETTQSKIAYEGDGVAVYLDLIYLDHSLSNDMVYMEGGTKYFKDQKFDDKFQETLLSYKNTLIRIGIYATSERPIPSSMLNDIGKNVVTYLNKTYQK